MWHPRRPRALVVALLALTFLCSAASVEPAAAAADGEGSLLLLLDASGSMREPARGGTTRIAAAKGALTRLVDELPAGTSVGLRVYGATKDSGCDDTTLVAPVRPLDKPGLKRAIARFTARGDTPIARSLQAAAADLRSAPGRKTIVLVSDGEETCAPPQPCDVARELAKQGVNLRVEAIGFQVNAAARRQLACVAKATGGRYHDAPDVRALSNQIRSLSLRAFRPYEPTGTPVTGTAQTAGAPLLQPGAYVDELAPQEKRYYAIEVPAGAVPAVNGALIAGATQPLLGAPENFLVILQDENGRECTRGYVSQSARTYTASATAVGTRARAGGDPCTQPGRRFVRVERQFGSGEGTNTLELLFTLVAAPGPGGTPAPPVSPGPTGGSTSAPKSVRGGTSYTDAAPIGAGSWQDTVRGNETLYYRVPVGWGQGLRVTATWDRLDPGRGFAGVTTYLLEVRDALRHDPGNRQNQQGGGQQLLRSQITTPAVVGPSADGDAIVPFKIAGDHYIAVNARELFEPNGRSVTSLRLDVTMTGTPGQPGPAFLPIAGASPSLSPAASASPTNSAPPAAAPSVAAGSGAGNVDAGIPAPALILALAALGVLTVVVGVALVRRRRAGSPSQVS